MDVDACSAADADAIAVAVAATVEEEDDKKVWNGSPSKGGELVDHREKKVFQKV